MFESTSETPQISSDEPTTAPQFESGGPLLSPEEARVLACLMEKDTTTPDSYPLTMNSLVAACNQRSNRNPVAEWEESTVEEAANGLRRKRLAVLVSLAGSRVPKYKHSVGEVLDRLTPATRAVLTELMLRGSQTLGEIRTNTDRLHSFADLSATEDAVKELINYPTGPLIVEIPPGGGKRVKSFGHLLCGPVESATAISTTTSAAILPPPADWKAEMEERIRSLEARLLTLEAFAKDLQG